VILDEPTSALDPLGRRAVRDLIVHLKDRGHDRAPNSHLLSEVERTCDEVAIIKNGRVVRQGTVGEITAATAARVAVEVEPGSEGALAVVTSRYVAATTETAATTATLTLPDEGAIPISWPRSWPPADASGRSSRCAKRWKRRSCA
jgi:ABC-2 type transport system ATP-binding protein